VGGDRAEVTSLIPIGIKPYDWEPTAQNVIAVQDADRFIFNGAGLEGKWITQIQSIFKVDTSKGIQLLQGGEQEGKGEAQSSNSSNKGLLLLILTFGLILFWQSTKLKSFGMLLSI
jgi:zinc transport system substrate-binding protein